MHESAYGPTRTCRACLLRGRYAGKRTLNGQRAIPIYEYTPISLQSMRLCGALRNSWE
jgi:hypothetical protein